VQQPDTGGSGTGAAPPTGTLTQEQVDKIVEQRLARAKAAAEREKAELQARLEEYERLENERKAAEMTEVEKAQAAAAAAKAEAEAAKAAAHAAEVKALRAEAVPADLPPAYRAMVTGETAEEIAESVAAVQAAFETDRRNVAEKLFQDLVALTPEQIAERYPGPGAAALAARLAGKPVNVGSPSNASGQGVSLPGTFDPQQPDPMAWARQREAEGYPPLPGMRRA